MSHESGGGPRYFQDVAQDGTSSGFAVPARHYDRGARYQHISGRDADPRSDVDVRAEDPGPRGLRHRPVPLDDEPDGCFHR